MTYQQTLDYIFSQLPMFHRIGAAAYKANLDNTLALDNYFGYPHKKFKTIHVAGTNGKGSVSHILASVLQHAGYKTGLYTSPHLKDFRERIKINGVTISEKSVTEFFIKHKPVFEKIKPSFFEMTVALAFDYFAQQNVDIAVIEVGLGGRLDSTNIITPELSVITNISFDHTALLGKTLKKIAKEKAGIIKPGIPVVVGESQPETNSVFIEKSKKLKSTIFFADKEYKALLTGKNSEKQVLDIFSCKEKNKILYKELQAGLLGHYQKQNIQTVLKSIDVLVDIGYELNKQNIYKGIKDVVTTTGLLGRWQILERKPCMICDTGHNIAGIKMVLKQIKETPHKKLHFVFGCVNDKDVDAILKILPKRAKYYFCRALVPRALDEKVLASKAACFGLSGIIFNNVQDAVLNAKKNAMPEDLIFIGGSTFVVADALNS